MDFLPMPKKVDYREGVFALGYRTVIVLTGTQPSALLYAQMLRDTIIEETGLTLSILRGDYRPGDISLRINASMPADTYHLNISSQEIRLDGGSDQALCHGVQTLRQWVKRNGSRLPALEIEDSPDFQNRGYYLDVSRGRVPTLQTLKEYADLLCRYKISEWQLYVEHTYLFRDFSEAWRDETPLTAEEIMELDAYCAARCIELVPSLSTFGHMYKILSTKTYCGLCELEGSDKVPFSYTYAADHHTLNVSSGKALPFILDMVDEYIQLFTSRKFNICADETFDLGKGRSREMAAKNGEHTLYINHVKTLCEHLVSRGRTPMFWGDIVVRFRDAYRILPKETICLNWGYLPNQRDYEIKTLAEADATQYACPGVCGWNRWVPLFKAAYDNNRVMCAHGRKYGAIGILNTDWGDYGHINHPWFSVPGILYSAAFSWNGGQAGFDEINRAISRLEYRDTSGRFMEGFAALSNHEVFDWTHAVRFIEAGDAGKRREIFREVDTAAVPSANSALKNALDLMHTAALTMPPSKRGILQAVDVVADGIRIFNDMAVFIAHAFYGQAEGDTSGRELAGELEAWFHAYLLLWRSVSKEGGIAKTMNIIENYANLLREEFEPLV